MSSPLTVNSNVYSTGKAEKISIEKSIDEIRKGNGFYCTGLLTSSANSFGYVYFRPINTSKIYHASFKFSAYPQAELYILEGTGSTNTGSGTAKSTFNINRTTSQTGSLIIVQSIATGAAGGATGSLIYSGYLPDWTTTTWGGTESRINELTLRTTPASGYFICFSGSAAGRLSYEIYWYEEMK